MLEISRVAALVEEADRDIAVFKRLYECIGYDSRLYSSALLAERILIDSYHISVGEYFQCLVLRVGSAVLADKFTHIVAENERSRHEAPEGEMAAVFFGSQISVADLEHIRVVPVALAGILEEIDIDFVYAEN